MGQRGEIFTTKVYAANGKKTFFFNVKENRYRDLFLNIVETKKKGESSFERHSMVIYKEDIHNFLNRFGDSLKLLTQGKESAESEFAADSGKRKYSFYVRRNKIGEYFLNITESRKDEDLMYQNESIRIFREQAADFQRGFDKAVEALLTK